MAYVPSFDKRMCINLSCGSP